MQRCTVWRTPASRRLLLSISSSDIVPNSRFGKLSGPAQPAGTHTSRSDGLLYVVRIRLPGMLRPDRRCCSVGMQSFFPPIFSTTDADTSDPMRQGCSFTLCTLSWQMKQVSRMSRADLLMADFTAKIFNTAIKCLLI